MSLLWKPALLSNLLPLAESCALDLALRRLLPSALLEILSLVPPSYPLLGMCSQTGSKGWSGHSLPSSHFLEQIREKMFALQSWYQ